MGLFAVVLMTACGEATGGGESIAALDPAALRPVGEDRDPLWEHRPRDVACPPAAWGEESGGFEIQTGVCAYGAFDQPLPLALVPGDTLVVTLWHDLLDAPEPGTGHVAVWVGDDVLWETEVAIPAPSNVIEAVVPITRAPAPDARLGLHLHNHGFNSWRFVRIDVLPR